MRKIGEKEYKKKEYMSKDQRNDFRKKRNKRKKINYFRLGMSLFFLILAFFCIIFGFAKLIEYFRNKEKITVETIQENIKEKDIDLSAVEKNTIEKINKVRKILENKEESLYSQIDSYLKVNNLDKNEINIAYSSNTTNSFENNRRNIDIRYIKDQRIPMSNSNVFIISMIAEDLERKGTLDLNTVVDLGEKNIDIEDDNYQKLSLSDLINQMIQDPETWRIKLVLEYVEKSAKSDWKTFANKYYGLSINTQNEMLVDDVIKILNSLIKKEDGKFIYDKTMGYLVKSAEKNRDIYYIEMSNFMAFTGLYEYEFTIELGIIMGEKPYIYLIQTNYSDKTINSDLRKLIYDWHISYN